MKLHIKNRHTGKTRDLIELAKDLHLIKIDPQILILTTNRSELHPILKDYKNIKIIEVFNSKFLKSKLDGLDPDYVLCDDYDWFGSDLQKHLKNYFFEKIIAWATAERYCH